MNIKNVVITFVVIAGLFTIIDQRGQISQLKADAVATRAESFLGCQRGNALRSHEIDIVLAIQPFLLSIAGSPRATGLVKQQAEDGLALFTPITNDPLLRLVDCEATFGDKEAP